MEWISVKIKMPPHIGSLSDFAEKPYVLAVDTKNRMSIGYCRRYQSGEYCWIFAKPIGEVTHWMNLPALPKEVYGVCPIHTYQVTPAAGGEGVDALNHKLALALHAASNTRTAATEVMEAQSRCILLEQELSALRQENDRLKVYEARQHSNMFEEEAAKVLTLTRRCAELEKFEKTIRDSIKSVMPADDVNDDMPTLIMLNEAFIRMKLLRKDGCE